MIKYKLHFFLLIYLVLAFSIEYFLIVRSGDCHSDFLSFSVPQTKRPEYSLKLSPNVQIINTNEIINKTFPCVKTKKLLGFLSTTVCLYESNTDLYVSGAFRDGISIWEEGEVTHILQLLLRHPHLDFIDIGANIGTYTMYAAALGRFVLAIDCFAPNLQRVHRAIQLTNVANRVVLVQNAIYSRSGELLRLSNNAENIGAQEIEIPNNETNNQNVINNPYLVKTIQFDDLLPILISRGIRGAIMKIDIEGSESFVVESGSGVFDLLDIPFIQMEWMNVQRYPERVQSHSKFFRQT